MNAMTLEEEKAKIVETILVAYRTRIDAIRIAYQNKIEKVLARAKQRHLATLKHTFGSS